jgi:hypothetical protein
MSGWRLAATAALATVGVVLALLLAGSSHGLALLAYVLFLGALALAALVGRLKAELPVAARFERLLAREPPAVAPVAQFETISRTLSVAGSNQVELHHRLRPLVREIALARLSRGHGVALEHEPERAREIVGDGRVWELVRPDREPPDDRLARGWSRRELAELLDELEAI